MDFHLRLVVGGGRKDFGLGGRNGGVTLDQLGHDAAHGLDTKDSGVTSKQQHVFDIALQYAALDGGADGYDLVRVDALHRILCRRFS